MCFHCFIFIFCLLYCCAMLHISWTRGGRVWNPLQLIALQLDSCYTRPSSTGGCYTRLYCVKFGMYISLVPNFNTASPMPAPAVVSPYGDEEVRNRALRCTSQAQFVPSIKNAEYEVTVESAVIALDIIYEIFGERPKLAVSTSLQPLRIGINAPFPLIV